jgi:pimeloyl-ACP methyl ester carboxylesterase
MVVGAVLAALLFYGGRSVYYEYYPVEVYPSESWEPFVSSLDAQREAFFIEVDGINLEAELFIPNGGVTQKPTVIFSPGSGDSLYQNYGFGLIETYVLDVFLARDMSVLLVNKRGMGQSEGLYTSGSIAGRAEDLLSVVEKVKNHPQIDVDNIGLVGHSEGGWVVSYAAAQNPEIAFFISLAGPTITKMEQAIDMYSYEAICAGLEGEDYVKYVEKRVNMTELGNKIGKITNFGLLGFDYRSQGFDPRNYLQEVEIPGLYIYGENDLLVLPDTNLERLDEIFEDGLPENLTVTVAEGATHQYRLVDDPCDSWNTPTQFEQSTEVIDILNDWLTEIGY